MPENAEPNGQPTLSMPEPSGQQSAPVDWEAGVVDHFKSEGYEIPEGVGGKALLGKLLERATADPDPQLVQHAAYGRQHMELVNSPQWKAYQEWQSQQQKQQQPPKPEEKGFEWPKLEWDDNWRKYLAQGPSGDFIPADQYAPAHIVSKANEYQQASAKQLRELLHNFPDLVNKVQESQWKKFKEEELSRILDERDARRETEQRAQAYIDQNDKELFVYNQQGQKVMDPATGQPLLNSHGKLMQFFIDEGWSQLQALTGPIEGQPTQQQWQWVQNYALLHTPRDVTAARKWNEYIAQITGQQQPAAAPAGAPTPPAPAPTPAQRNAAGKARSVANARQKIKEEPGDIEPSRNVAKAARTNGHVPDLAERLLADAAAGRV